MANNHKQYWQKLADMYDKNVGEQGDIRHQYVVNPVVFEMLGDLSGKIVLDAACGNGYLTREMAKTAEKVVGVDVTEKLIEKALEKDNPEHIEFIVSDISSLHFALASFDAVLCNMALMDMERMPEVVKELSRVLKNGGILVASIIHPCFENPPYTYSLFEGEKRIGRVVQQYFTTGLIVDPSKEDTPGINYQHYHFTLSQYLNAFSEAGLGVTKTVEPNGNEIIGGGGGNDHTPTFMIFMLTKNR